MSINASDCRMNALTAVRVRTYNNVAMMTSVAVSSRATAVKPASTVALRVFIVDYILATNWSPKGW